MSIRSKISQILQHLAAGMYEKEEALRLSLLAAIAGESIFLLGPPGVAKSLVARKLKFAFAEGNSFEYLMNKFSTPDEIFGPVSIKKLKDEDKYERLTDRYLPGANIVFLDEIWKAGPAIQNALLTVLNEKIYRNGEQEVAVNIRAILSASNEVPLQADGVDALWDRFLIRYLMQEVRTPLNFIKMITATENLYTDNVPAELKITEAELQAWAEAIQQVEVPAEVSNCLQVLKYQLEQYNDKQKDAENKVMVFDRRWKKIVNLLRTAAFLNERTKVDLMDCFLALHCLWARPQQIEPLQQILVDIVRKHGYSLQINLTNLKKEIEAFEEEVEAEVKVKHKVFKDELLPVETDYFELLNAQQYFDGCLVKKSEFVRLAAEEYNSISLYDKQFALTNRVNARLATQENSLEINYNSQILPIALRTQKVEKTATIFKKPHPIVQAHWDERRQLLADYIAQQRQFLEQERPDELHNLKNNLFVPPQFSEIVEANIQEVTKNLEGLALRLEKLVFLYEAVQVG